MEWLFDLVSSTVGQSILTAIGGIFVMSWGWLRERMPLAFAVACGITTMAMLLVIINQIGWEPSTKVKIRNWFNEAGYSIREVPPSQASDFEFRYEVKVTTMKAPETTFYVYRPKYGLTGFVMLELVYDAVASFPALKTIDQKRLQALHRQLAKDFALRGIAFTFLQPTNPLNFKSLERIVVSNAIPHASLTQDRLMQGVQNLIHGVTIANNNVGIVVER
jgi:hypothetical protein